MLLTLRRYVDNKEIVIGNHEVQSATFPGPNYTSKNPTTILVLKNGKTVEVMGKMLEVKEILWHNEKQLQIRDFNDDRTSQE